MTKVEIDYIFDLNESLYLQIWRECRWIRKVLSAATGKRIGIVVEGFGVPHVHVHLVPIEKCGDIDPNKAKGATRNEFLEIQQLILEKMRVYSLSRES